jgi:leucyl-tRNA synthetase
MEWTETSVQAMSRFVNRLWNVVNEVIERAPEGEPEGGRSRGRRTRRSPRSPTTSAALRLQHRDRAVMELVNELSKERDGADSRFAAETAVR